MVNKTTAGTERKPMSAEARQRIAQGLRKSAQAKALAKPGHESIAATPAQSPVSVEGHSEASAIALPVEAVADARQIVP